MRAQAARADGVSFPEITITMAVMMIAAVAVMSLLLVTMRQASGQADRIAALDEARNGLLQMTNEIRSASGLDSVSPQVLDVLIHVPEDPVTPYHWVRYKCAGNDQGRSQGQGGKCTRQDKTLNPGADCADDGTGAGCVVVMRHVVKVGEADHFAEPCDNFDVSSQEEKHFCVQGNRTVQLTVSVEVPGATNPIELRNAVTVRNCMNNQDEVIPCVESTPSA